MTPRDELEDLRPYLELAREIRAEVDQVASAGRDAGAGLEAALDAIPDRERRRVALSVFERLPAEQQWAVLERVFDDGEIRSFLAELHQGRRDEVGRRAGAVALRRAARAAGQIDLGALPPMLEVTIGMFRPADVQSAIGRGAASSSCARQVVVRATGDGGGVHVLDDVFNPRHGLFVTSDYDEAVWSTERLDSHSVVRLGSARPDGDDGFEPALYPGGRVDVEVAGTVRRGRLHLGFVLIGGEDVFAAIS